MNTRNRTTIILTLGVVPIVVVMSFCCADASAAPIILNPSFETDTFTTGPGGTVAQNFAISSWTDNSAADVGINPFWTVRPTTPGGSPHADNGAIPDGDQVAFLRYTATLSQPISGFEVGKTYEISYHENNRSTNAPGGLQVSMDSTVIVANHATTAVGGSNPYQFVTSNPFTATSTTHTLKFESTSGLDRSVLIDDITIADSGLIAHWKLDETSGQIAFDSARNNDGQLGTTTGSDSADPTINQPGKFGTAYSFDGSDDQVVLTDVSSFSSQTTGTIAFWFNTDIAGRDGLFSYNDAVNDRLTVSIEDNDTIRFLVRDAAINHVDLQTVALYDDNAWHHLAVTQDGVAAKLYIDGSEITGAALTTTSNGGEWFSTVASPVGLFIGRDNFSGVGTLNGLMDDVRIYDNALSASEVAALVPEPSTLALAAIGLLGLLACGRRRRR